MVEPQSFLFDFTRVDSFFDQWNLAFKLTDMTTSNNFELVFCYDAPNNIEECLNGTVLDESKVSIAQNGVVPCSLKWEDNGISLRNNATWNIVNESPLKAIFLRVRSNKYVMSYCINIEEFTCTNKIIFEGGLLFWRIIYE